VIVAGTGAAPAPVVGQSCQVALDGVGYFVEPRGYRMHRPRLRRAAVGLDGSEHYTDQGMGRREWHLTVLALGGLEDYTGGYLAGAPGPGGGQAIREALRASYEKVGATLGYTDLDGAAYSVRFDDYAEVVRDPRSQLVAVSYHVQIVLVEA